MKSKIKILHLAKNVDNGLLDILNQCENLKVTIVQKENNIDFNKTILNPKEIDVVIISMKGFTKNKIETFIEEVDDIPIIFITENKKEEIKHDKIYSSLQREKLNPYLIENVLQLCLKTKYSNSKPGNKKDGIADFDNKLESNEELFNALVYITGDIVLILNNDFTISKTYVKNENINEIKFKNTNVKSFKDFLGNKNNYIFDDFHNRIKQSGKLIFETKINLNESDLDFLVFMTPIYQKKVNEIKTIICVLRDITERKKIENSILKRLEYEEKLAACSNALLSLENESEAVQKALNYLLEATEVSRVYINQNFIDENRKLCMRRKYEVCDEGIKPCILDEEFKHIEYNDFKRWDSILRDDGFIWGNVDDFPEKERDFFNKQNTKSILVLPIWIGKELYGNIGFEDVNKSKEWYDADIRLLITSSEIIGSFIKRQMTEKEIINERDKAKTYLAVAGVMFIVLDIKGAVTLINQKGCEILKEKKENIIGANWFDKFIPDDEKNKVGNYFNSVINCGTEIKEEYENHILNKNNEKRLIKWRAILLKDDIGNINGILSSGEDITEKRAHELELNKYRLKLEDLVEERTKELKKINNLLKIEIEERRKIEESLRESKQQFEDMFYKHSAIMLLVDPSSGSIIDANQAALDFYGYKQNSLKKMKISDINVLADASIKSEMRKAADTEKNYFIFKHKLADGEIRDVEVHSNPIWTMGKRFLFSIIVDITARKKAERALKESEKKFRALVENANDGIVLINVSTYEITYVNKAFVDMLKYSEEEIYKIRNFISLVSDDVNVRNIFLNRKRDRKLGKTVKNEVETIFKDKYYNDINVIITSSEVMINDELVLISIIKDISKRKKAERELIKAKENAERVNRLKNEFLGYISHEIRTPLGLITLNSSYLLREKKCSENFEDKLMQIKNSVKNAVHIIDEVLDISRIEAGEMEIEKKEFQPNKTVESVIDDFKIFAEHSGIKLFAEIEVNDYIYSDEKRIKQILINLVSNALKYTFEGEVKIELSKSPEFFIFSVSDTGCGIDEENLNKVFEPFFRVEETRNRRKGMGLGLTICQKIIKNLGGSMYVESSKGKGSVFYFKVPNLK